MIIKVCGLTKKTPLRELAPLPIDWGGLIFVESSPRYIGHKKPFELPAGIKRVGVFRDQFPSRVQTISAAWKLDFVQLHGRETPDQVEELRECGCRVIKTISVKSERDLRKASKYDEADYLLFDRGAGGTGEKFDWGLLGAYEGEVPFLLAGGIGPDDAERVAAVEHPRLAGFDLNSRFETAPGVKDPALLYQFLHHELPR